MMPLKKWIFLSVVGFLLFGWWAYLQQFSIAELSFQSPRWILGADFFGRDELGRPIGFKLAHATLNSLLIASASLGLSFLIGALLGAHALWPKRWRVFVHGLAAAVTLLPSFLTVLLFKIGLESAFGSLLSLNILCLVLAMAFEGWVPFTYFIESEIEYVLNQEYVKASVALGASRFFLLKTHIFPVLRQTAFRFSKLQLSHFVLAESFLSFLGLGIRPPYFTLGGMLALGFENIVDAPHLFYLPGLVLIALNFYWLHEKNSVVEGPKGI